MREKLKHTSTAHMKCREYYGIQFESSGKHILTMRIHHVQLYPASTDAASGFFSPNRISAALEGHLFVHLGIFVVFR